MSSVLSKSAEPLAPQKLRQAERIDPLKIALFPARIFLALGWIRAATEKAISGSWWGGEEVRLFLTDHQDSMLPFLRPFATLANTQFLSIVISAAVLALELAIGLCLVTGSRVRSALFTACALNIAFVALGAVAPSAFYLVLQTTLLFGIVAFRPVGSVRKNLLAIGGCLAFGAALTPFIETLHPRYVIEDPAIMLATLAAIVAATLGIRLIDHRSALRQVRL